MAYNTKSIKKDVDGKPIPQYFNPAVDDYEVLQGRNGAQRVEIYGPDGNPLSTIENKLDVRASEVEALLTALGAKDFATQTTLAQILAKIIPAPATEAKQDALIAKDFATETTLAGGIVSLLSAIAETASETTAALLNLSWPRWPGRLPFVGSRISKMPKMARCGWYGHRERRTSQAYTVRNLK